MGERADGGSLVGRLISGGLARDIRAATDRVEALERALAEELGRCPGCGGSGYEPDTEVACPRCAAARAVLAGGEVAHGADA